MVEYLHIQRLKLNEKSIAGNFWSALDAKEVSFRRAGINRVFDPQRMIDARQQIARRRTPA
ncbi:hypothetical protein [Bradyrhizobium genosp. P]|uniref:hypothetical protein n=1 Tax=Bradyrhizobium genosp. P TaxID=83641 RepID=UPI003CE6A036